MKSSFLMVILLQSEFLSGAAVVDTTGAGFDQRGRWDYT